MRRFVLATAIVWIAAALGASSLAAQDVLDERTKLAQTGMQFLSVSVDARAGAMGDAMTAQEASSTALFYNLASMARMESMIHVSLGQNQWIADINYNVAGIAFRPSDGTYGTFGFSLVSVNYGDLLGTIRSDNEQGFTDTGTYSPSALAAGLGYARALSDRFSVGGQIKYVRQALGESTMSISEGGNRTMQDNTVGTLAFDFGMLYQTGFRSLNFAVSARNFAQEMTYVEESFELPLTFRIGASVDLLDLGGMEQDTHSFLFAVDAIHPRDYVEQGRVGAEYMFMNTLALRAGYVFPSDEQGINLGVGVQQIFSGIGFSFDYAYSDFGTLGDVNRLSLQLSLQ